MATKRSKLEKTIRVYFNSEHERKAFESKVGVLTQHFFCTKSELMIKLVQSTSIPNASSASSREEFTLPYSYQGISSGEAENVEIIATCPQSLEQLMLTSYNTGLARLGQAKLELNRRCIYAGIFNVPIGTCSWLWKSSPYTSDGSYLVNIKIAFGTLMSGMLMEVYKRFSSGANFGIVTDDLIDHKTFQA